MREAAIRRAFDAAANGIEEKISEPEVPPTVSVMMGYQDFTPATPNHQENTIAPPAPPAEEKTDQAMEVRLHALTASTILHASDLLLQRLHSGNGHFRIVHQKRPVRAPRRMVR